MGEQSSLEGHDGADRSSFFDDNGVHHPETSRMHSPIYLAMKEKKNHV
jgi:hypothetical protein